MMSTTERDKIRSAMFRAVLETCPDTSTTTAIDVVDRAVVLLELADLTALFETVAQPRKGTRPSPPRSAGENDDMNKPTEPTCPCGKPLSHTDGPDDACLVPLASLREANPARWGIGVTSMRLEHMPGRDVDALVVFEGDA